MRRIPLAGLKDRGAASLEFTGTMIAASILVIAVLTAFTVRAPELGRRAAQAICEVVTLGRGDCGAFGRSLAKDRTPSEPCVVTSDSVSMNREVAVVIVTAKDGRSFEVAKLSDGRYRVTRVSSGGAGMEAGVGAGASVTINDHKYGGAADADVGAGLDFTSGQVFYAKNTDELNKLINEEAEDSLEDAYLQDGPARWLWERGQDAVGAITGPGDYEFPTPDEVYAEGGVVINGSAEATGLATSGSADLAVSEGLGVRTTKDGKTTVYLKTSAEGSAQLQSLGIDPGSLGPAFTDGSAEGKLELLTSVTFDSSGNLIQVSTTATAAGESKGLVAALFNGNPDASLSNSASAVTVYQATLPIASAQDRSTALAFLAASGVMQLAGPGLQLATAVPAAQALAEFRRAAADHGTVTQQHLDLESSTPFALDATGEIGVELGLSADVRKSELTSTGGEYWDGAHWQTWTGCAA